MAIPNEIVSIQYLRGLAALGVVIFHLGEIFIPQTLLITSGASGVDLFFVISGFIMWVITRQRETSPGNFLIRRVVRIVPLYWVVTLLLAAGALFKPNLFPFDEPEFYHVVQSLLFVPHWAPNGSLLPLVGQGWTLNYEMFFYAIFAAALVAPARLRLRLLTVTMTVLVLLGALNGSRNPAILTYTSSMLLEFLFGIWLGAAYLGGRILGSKLALSALFVGAGAILAMPFVGTAVLPRAIVYGIPAALIVFAAVSLECRGILIRNRLLKILGDASYSIYLTHYMTALCWSILLARAGVSAAGHVPYLLAAGLAVVGGVLFYFLVEQPIEKAARSGLFNGSRGRNAGPQPPSP